MESGNESQALESEDSRRVYRSDPTLIQACLDGDETAWNELVERYGRLVYSIPRRYGFSDTDADDIFQNVFTIVLRRLDSLRDQTRLSAWLITTTQRECWRLSKRMKNSDELDETIVDARAAPPEQVQRWERQHLVREALSQLDPRCQELLTALFLDNTNPSYEEVAGRLDMAVGSIGPTRARCFKRLEAILVKMGLDFGS
jgi:RNA polymerase sigma factor (sigma-70 family)